MRPCSPPFPLPFPFNMQAVLMKWVMRAFSLMFLPAGGMVSAGVGILWVSNSGFAVLQVRLSIEHLSVHGGGCNTRVLYSMSR